MRIIHIASELAPFVKVGGLGDVIQGLSHSLQKKGHTVEIVLPAYRSLKNAHLPGEVTLLETPGDFFDRENLYGYEDDSVRFATFARAAVDYLKGRPYDVLHLHDWHTALIAAFLPRTLLTIHNLAYMGICDKKLLDTLDLKEQAGFKEGQKYSLLRGGIEHADYVTTVSPTYAQEILNSDHGLSLRPLLNKHTNKLVGILNGIDTTFWDPENDPYLPFPFSTKQLIGKQKIKEQIQHRFGLEKKNVRLVCAVTRLVPQKGPELIKAAIEKTRELGGQFILLGSALDPKFQSDFEKLDYRDDPNVHLELKFNENLSHEIFAAADLLIVPSIFEPCGLTQMIAMRYGTVPLVRKTGGLADSVEESRNGFVFEEPKKAAINEALERAFACPDKKWSELQQAGMQEDFSWDVPTMHYLDLYKKCGEKVSRILS